LNGAGRAPDCARAGYITVHPSFLLRLPDEGEKQRERAKFAADLKKIKAVADELAEPSNRRAGSRN
jgi:uracil-DNA glycosylase